MHGKLELHRGLSHAEVYLDSRWMLLPVCTKEAENLDIILACDGAASVGQASP
jgi:uncharacterized metal-binding protein